MPDSKSPGRLSRELGLLGAVMMGLGSIVGTGVFVSLGVAAGGAGPAVVVAVALGAGVATCEGLSSAQLAANHAVSGGHLRVRVQVSDARARLYGGVASTGLLGCCGLAFFVTPWVWSAGLGLIAAGLLWHYLARQLRATSA